MNITKITLLNIQNIHKNIFHSETFAKQDNDSQCSHLSTKKIENENLHFTNQGRHHRQI